MSIPAPRSELDPREDSRGNRLAKPLPGRRGDVALLVVVVIFAALLRIDFIRGAKYVIDSDEAIVGLMARHILEGRGIPTFYYGQHYMGSLEALCAAAMFSVFGASPFVLQLTPLLFSLALIVVMYRLGCEVGGVVVGRVAAILTAFPPVALVVWSYKARGGFIELLFIAALATLCVLKWLKRDPKEARYAVLAWLLLGLGWWVNNQIVYFVVPLGAIGAAHVLGCLRAGRLSLGGVVRLSWLCSAAFLVGSAPYWVYNVRNGFPSLGMFGLASPEKIVEHLSGLWITALPILLGAKRFWESEAGVSVASIIVYVVYGGILTTVLIARRKAIGELLKGKIDTDSQVEVLFLLMIFSCAVFTVSTYGWLSQAPRYLLPLYIPLFVLCGLFIKSLASLSRPLALCALGLLVIGNLASCYLGGRAIPGEPFVYKSERASRSHADVIAALDQLGITKVRTNYWIGYRLAFETGERVTFLVLQEPNETRLAEYRSLPQGVTQDLVPLLIVPSERPIFIGALDRLGYSYRERRAGDYILIFDIKRPAMERIPINPEGRVVVTASGSRDPNAALDGALNSRWATGAPQRAGQVFEVVFKEPVVVSGLRYQLGEWTQDYPRGMRIVVEDDRGATVEVLSPQDYAKLAVFFRGSDFELWFKPHSVRKITFEQTGAHSVLDWSIAEISLYRGNVETREGKGGDGHE